MKKTGRLIEAMQDGDIILRKTAKELQGIYYCDLSTIYAHIRRGAPFGGIIFRWAREAERR